MTTYRLEIPDEKWTRFKKTVSKGQTINDVLERCIDERLQESKATSGIREGQ